MRIESSKDVVRDIDLRIAIDRLTHAAIVVAMNVKMDGGVCWLPKAHHHSLLVALEELRPFMVEDEKGGQAESNDGTGCIDQLEKRFASLELMEAAP